MSSFNNNQVNKLFPGLNKIMQGYTGSLNGEASVYGHSQPAGPSASPIQESVLSPASSSMVSGLTILLLWNPRPKSRNQTRNLDSLGHRAYGLRDRPPAFFWGPTPRADAEDDGPPSETDQAKKIIALSGVPITTPNGGNQAITISFMSLKSSPATN
ncbi:hypothetical protein DSO57_1016765 [Entomophthora muscae]|uniref:Uncharacterized protein n=1 Tax=Entomophthora muscae TaxID=34485 RepID=A0ACC2SI44_9FUNG|nr:hypothetical protein DSO57_1016765 [Entomophthora muscae]